ncbi:MAG: TPM domain-containing protein [Rhizobiales bacterium]|nr:TPM domain-containing protein [Hyphomicrobiales bacterium]NRB15171.1 TPM domain-containing protein [Hyphomicrobiales bacterium]
MISKQQLNKIAETVGVAESKTKGEIVVVLAKQSDDYHYIPALWAALFSLALPLVVILLGVFNPDSGSYANDGLSLEYVYIGQLLVFILAFLALRWRPIKLALIPKYIKHRRAGRLAALQFVTQGVHVTTDHTGVLLFISLAEHYVEVVADSGIHKKLDGEIWQNIVDDLITNVKQGQMSEGIISAIEQIGILLATHFPDDGKVNEDELANHLIILD